MYVNWFGISRATITCVVFHLRVFVTKFFQFVYISFGWLVFWKLSSKYQEASSSSSCWGNNSRIVGGSHLFLCQNWVQLSRLMRIWSFSSSDASLNYELHIGKWLTLQFTAWALRWCVKILSVRSVCLVSRQIQFSTRYCSRIHQSTSYYVWRYLVLILQSNFTPRSSSFCAMHWSTCVYLCIKQLAIVIHGYSVLTNYVVVDSL